MTVDDLNLAVRNLVRVVLAMPDGSVRPANQSAPAGAQTKEFATVKIVTVDVHDGDLGTAADEIDQTVTNEVLESPEVFVASVQFFRAPTKDAGGIALYSMSAFERSVRLVRLLGMSSAIETMRIMGLGLMEVGTPRNLAGIADATWESRGQVDLTFNVISRDIAPIPVIESVDITISVPPAPPVTTTVEVNP